MSFIDGEKGILEYVGIPIDDLASNSTFEETVFLLWNRGFRTSTSSTRSRPTFARTTTCRAKHWSMLIQGCPKDARPCTSADDGLRPGTVRPGAQRQRHPGVRNKAMTILAVTPAIIAVFHRLPAGPPLVAPDKNLSFAATSCACSTARSPRPRWPGPSTCA